MRKAEFVAAAREEFLAEVVYYNTAQEGLGSEFAVAIEKTTALALVFPEIGAPFDSDTRRMIVKGFPFSLIYKPSTNGIVVFAVAHQSRQPGYWSSRVATGR